MRHAIAGFGLFLMALPALAAPLPDAVAVDNAHATARDVYLRPGGPAQSLPRDRDVVIFYASDGPVRSIDAQGHARMAAHHVGDAVFLPRGTAGTEAAVSGPVHEVVIALKDNPPPLRPDRPEYPIPYPRPGVTKVLENARVIVWDVTWPDTLTPQHFHRHDSLAIFHRSGAVRAIALDGSVHVETLHAGEIAAGTGGRVHAEIRAAGNPFATVMEFK